MPEPAATTVLPPIAVLLPEGWVRLRFDHTIDDQVARTVRTSLRAVEPARRDIARVQLRRLFDDMVQRARAHAYEVWFPIAPTGGVTIPVSVTVAPPPRAIDPARSVADHLSAFATSAAGSTFVTVGGRPAVRLTSDIRGSRDEEGRWTELPRRRITALVSPGVDGEWLVFVAEIIVPEQDPEEIVAACEFFVDAFLRTVRFPSHSEVAP